MNSISSLAFGYQGREVPTARSGTHPKLVSILGGVDFCGNLKGAACKIIRKMSKNRMRIQTLIDFHMQPPPKRSEADLPKSQ